MYFLWVFVSPILAYILMSILYYILLKEVDCHIESWSKQVILSTYSFISFYMVG